MRPRASTTAPSGFSSATSGVTASTVASRGRRSAASTKRRKSAARHQASTVETSMRPAPGPPATSRKLSSDEAVVFTVSRRSSSGNRPRTHAAQSRSCSLTMIDSRVMPAATKFRIADSISGTPATGTMGLGTAQPACLRRLPSPAAMMPPERPGSNVTAVFPPGRAATGSRGRPGSTAVPAAPGPA